MINHKQFFDSDAFHQQFHTDLPLGSFCREDGTLFRLWAPTAEGVILNLYHSGDGEEAPEAFSMTLKENGVWEYDAKRDLSGRYYDYSVTVEGVTQRSADPYAKACALNGQRSMVIDLKITNPDGWEQDTAPARPKEDIIYEIHVKDFSWDAASGVTKAHRGKFLALTEENTSLHGDGIHPTCLSYLKRLGVTHVQLMPVYDYGSVDEGGSDEQFNWGYDPVNYNVPEGSYSTDPRHGEVRIRELKQAVQSLHKNGFRVIMDVVYNHTYSLDSWLNRTVPWYFYRQNEDGTPSNGSGCGNDIATERSMVSRYILDSVLYWAEEYHMDGFRFDLMGLMDVPLMNRIRKALDDRYGVGEKVLLGEPWSAGKTAAKEGTLLSVKSNWKQLDDNLAAFCDATRDAVKGNLMQEGAKGFVNGGGLSTGHLEQCLKGWVNAHGDFSVNAPSQTITYLSSHDDWTLWDRLVFTMDENKEFEGYQPTLLRANRLAAAINACCQGHLFLLSGEEFARTKQGIRDSFSSPVTVNRLDWQRAWKNQKLVDYYRGLFALRKQLVGLQEKSREAHLRIQTVEQLAENCVSVLVDNRGDGSRWNTLLLCFNAGQENLHISLPDGKWQLLADGESSFLWRENLCLTEKAILLPVSALILGLES